MSSHCFVPSLRGLEEVMKKYFIRWRRAFNQIFLIMHIREFMASAAGVKVPLLPRLAYRSRRIPLTALVQGVNGT